MRDYNKEVNDRIVADIIDQIDHRLKAVKTDIFTLVGMADRARFGANLDLKSAQIQLSKIGGLIASLL